MKKILEVKNLSKYFISRHGVNKAVDNVSFDILEGEIIGLMGQSGSGKTTIGKAILRLIDEVNGVVVVDGKIVSGRKISRSAEKTLRKNVQTIFQDPHSALNEKRNVYSTLKEPLQVHHIIDKQLDEFWENWEEIVRVFIFSSKISFHQDELKFMQMKKDMIVKYYDKLEAFLDTFKINESISFKDNSDLLFSERYSEKFNIYRELINELAEQEVMQFSKFDEYRKKFNNRELLSDEINYVNALGELRQYDKTWKRSKYHKLILAKLKFDRNMEIFNFKRETKLNIASLQNELKTRIKFHSNLASLAHSFSSYEMSILRKAAIKAQYNMFKKIPKEVCALNTDQLIELSSLLSDSATLLSNDVISKLRIESAKVKGTPEEILSARKEIIKNLIKTIVVPEFNYDKYIQASEENIAVINKKHDVILQNEIDFELNKPEFSKQIRSALIENVNNAKIKNDEGITNDRDAFEKEFIKLTEQIAEVTSFLNSDEFAARKQKVYEKYDTIIDQFHKQVELGKASKKELDKFKQFIKENNTRDKDYQYEMDKVAKQVNKLQYVFNIKQTHPIIRKRIVKNMFFDKTIFAALEQVGLKAEHAYRYPHEFSGGQKQRIVIARALMAQPKILIADEPIASLDISIQAQVVNLLRKLVKEKGISMLFIGHDLTMIEYIAQNSLIMHLGKIVEYGNSTSIFKNPVHIYTKTLFEAIPRISNANVPFKQYESVNSYLRDYNVNNQPSYHKVASDHFVYCSDEQFNEWNGVKNVDTLLDEKNEIVVVEENLIDLDLELQNNSPITSVGQIPDYVTIEAIDNDDLPNAIGDEIIVDPEFVEVQSLALDEQMPSLNEGGNKTPHKSKKNASKKK